MRNFFSEEWRQPKVWVALIGILGLVLVLSLAVGKKDATYPNQVTITGQGRVAYQPDTATVTLGVQIDKVSKAEEALNQLNQKISAITAEIKKIGIPETNIQTQNYSLYPQYDYPASGISMVSGYNANQQMAIKIENINDNSQLVSQVISVASKAGANQISGVTFSSSKLNDLKQEARLKAIADARAKAPNLAQNSGVRLGKIIGWYENLISTPETSSVYYGGIGGGEAKGGGATVTNGSQEIIIEVGVNYKIR